MLIADGGGGSSSRYATNTQREIMAVIGSLDSTALDRTETMWRDTAASAREIHGLISKRLADLTGPNGWTGQGADAYRAAIKRDLLDPLEAYAGQAERNADALKPVNQAVSSSVVSALLNDIPWDRDTSWRVDRKNVEQSLFGKIDEFVTGKDEDYEKAKAEAPYLVINGQQHTVDTVDHTRWETLLKIYPQLAQSPQLYRETNTRVTPQVHRFDQLMEALGLNSAEVTAVRGRADDVDTQLDRFAPAGNGGGDDRRRDGSGPGTGQDGSTSPTTTPGSTRGTAPDLTRTRGGDPRSLSPGDPGRPDPSIQNTEPGGQYPGGPGGGSLGGPETPGRPGGPGTPGTPDPGGGTTLTGGGPGLSDPAELSANLPAGTEAAGLNTAPGAAAGLSNLGGHPGAPGGAGSTINVGSGIVPSMGTLGGLGSLGGPGGAGGLGGRAGLGPGGPGGLGRGGVPGGPGAGGNPMGGRSGNSFEIGPNGRGVVNPGSVGPLAGPHGSGTPGPGGGVPMAPGGKRQNNESGKDEDQTYNSWLEEDEDVWFDTDRNPHAR